MRGFVSAGDGVTVFRALASRVVWILIAVVFGSTLALTGVVVHLSALLTDRGLPASRAAIVLSVLGGASLAGRLVTGWCLNRFAAPRVACALLALAAFGTFSLIGVTSFSAAAVAAALIGLGTGGEFDVVPLLLSRHFGLRSRRRCMVCTGSPGARPAQPALWSWVVHSTQLAPTTLSCWFWRSCRWASPCSFSSCRPQPTRAYREALDGCEGNCPRYSVKASPHLAPAIAYD